MPLIPQPLQKGLVIEPFDLAYFNSQLQANQLARPLGILLVLPMACPGLKGTCSHNDSRIFKHNAQEAA